MNTTTQRGAFVSYSRKDGEFALKLAKELRSAGHSVWLDQLDIQTGVRWDDAVEKALYECQIFLIILTPESVSSDNVKDEIGYAIDNGKRIMPVLLEECAIPLRLSRFQYVDFTKIDFSEGLKGAKQLLEALQDELSTLDVTIDPEREPQKTPDGGLIPQEPAHTDNRLQHLSAIMGESDSRHALGETILTLFENAIKGIEFDHPVMTDVVLTKLADVCVTSHNWAHGELSFIGTAGNKMLLQMYKQAEKNIFATVVPEYNEAVWMKPFGEKLLQAHKASQAHQITRVFLFDDRHGFTERHLKLMEAQVKANITVLVYFDKEDPTYDLPAEMLRDFIIIDDGQTIGVTTSIRPTVVESTWYFGREDKIQFFENIKENLMHGSIPFAEIKEWWSKQTAGAR